MPYIDIDPSTPLPALPESMEFTYSPFHVAIMETVPGKASRYSVTIAVKQNPNGEHLPVLPEDVAGLAQEAFDRMKELRG